MKTYSIKILNKLCETSLFTKREQSLIFSSLKKSLFLESMLLVNFWIWWYLNFLNVLNILTMLNKSIIRCSSVGVTIFRTGLCLFFMSVARLSETDKLTVKCWLDTFLTFWTELFSLEVKAKDWVGKLFFGAK